MSPHKILRHRPFALLLCGRLLTTTAVQMQSVALGWQVYTVARLTHNIAESSFLVGMVGLAQFLPLLALTLIGGESADRYERRKIMLACSVVQAVNALCLMLVTMQHAPPLGWLFMGAALFGVTRAFLAPSIMALGPTLVPKDELPQAVAMNTLSVQVGMILGPWLAGILCAVAPFWAFAASGACFALAGVIFVVLLLMRLNTGERRKPDSRMAMIKEGLVYLWTNKAVLGAISLDLFAVLLGGVTALLPVYARDILHIGPDGFGMLRSCVAIGGGAMTLMLSIRPVRRHVGVWMLSALCVYGVATIVFGLSEIMGLSMAMLVILGAADSISVYVRQSFVQIMTPNHMRGRVSAVSSLFISASNELGEFESGVAARLLGPVGSAVFGGAGSIFITALWSRMFPSLRKADRLAPPPEL